MPSKSKAQHNLMAMVAHDPKAAKRLGIPQSVGKDFVAADKGKKFGTGGRPDLQKVNKPKTDHGKLALFKEGGMATKKLFGGKETYSEELKEAKAVKSGKISPKQFVSGEKSEGHKEEASAKLAKQIKSGKMSPGAYAKMESKEPAGMKSGGRAMAKGMHSVQTKSKRGAEMVKMAGGGYVRSADGVAVKGKTKGKMC